MRATNTFQALCLGATLGLTGCVTVHDRGYGPAPHAPAYGYDRGYDDDVDYVYDNHARAYTVVGLPEVWFSNGWYYRHSRGYWERCERPRGGHWSRADWAYVPPGLRPRYGDWHGGHDGWDRRDARREEHHERVDWRREQRDERQDWRHDQKDERRDDHHDRVDARREQRDERADWRHDRHDAQQAERHDRVDARREARGERTELRHDRVDAKRDERHERQDARHDERQDRKEQRRDQRDFAAE